MEHHNGLAVGARLEQHNWLVVGARLERHGRVAVVEEMEMERENSPSLAQQPSGPAADNLQHGAGHFGTPGCNQALCEFGSTRSSGSSKRSCTLRSYFLPNCISPACPYGSSIVEPIPSRRGIPVQPTRNKLHSLCHILGLYHAGLCSDFDRTLRKGSNNSSCTGQMASSTRRESCGMGETY